MLYGHVCASTSAGFIIQDLIKVFLYTVDETILPMHNQNLELH